MESVTTGTVLRQIQAVLREGFEGPKERWSYFTDNNPDAGLLGTVGGLRAAEASRQIGGGSIAAHVHHVVFALEASSGWIRGERKHHNWAESWSVSTVDDAAWARLLERLRAGYDDLRAAIEGYALTSEESIGGAVAALAHLGYHLGAIQQKLGFAGRRP